MNRWSMVWSLEYTDVGGIHVQIALSVSGGVWVLSPMMVRLTVDSYLYNCTEEKFTVSQYVTYACSCINGAEAAH